MVNEQKIHIIVNFLIFQMDMIKIILILVMSQLILEYYLLKKQDLEQDKLYWTKTKIV